MVATLDFQKSSNNFSVYIDGNNVSNSTVAVTNSFSTSNADMTIGKYNNNGGPFVGKLAGAFVYDRALTAGEVSSIYTTGTVTNQAPLVVVGASTNLVQWPANSATVYATVTDDGLPNPPGTVTGSWSKVSTPSGGSVVFSGTSGLSSVLTFSGTGTYIVRYTASDSKLSNYGDVTINVVANQAPVITSCTVTPALVEAGTNPAVTLNAFATDDGLPNPPGVLTTTWSQLSGPAAVTVAYPGAFSTTASVPAVTGTYVMQFSAYDGAVTTSTNVTFVVTNNLAPSISAGADPNTMNWNGSGVSTTLRGSITDDGHPLSPGILGGSWTQISGPATATLSTPATSGLNNRSIEADSAVTFPAQGPILYFKSPPSTAPCPPRRPPGSTSGPPVSPIVIPGRSARSGCPMRLALSPGRLSPSAAQTTRSMVGRPGSGLRNFRLAQRARNDRLLQRRRRILD